jgi:hypothetical protein
MCMSWSQGSPSLKFVALKDHMFSSRRSKVSLVDLHKISLSNKLIIYISVERVCNQLSSTLWCSSLGLLEPKLLPKFQDFYIERWTYYFIHKYDCSFHLSRWRLGCDLWPSTVRKWQKAEFFDCAYIWSYIGLQKHIMFTVAQHCFFSPLWMPFICLLYHVVFCLSVSSKSMLSGSTVTMAWRVLRLRIEDMASRCAG